MLRLLAVSLAIGAAALDIDKSHIGDKFWGLGGLSGGGATSRLLPDYPEEQASEILDLLFKPNYGASLHTLKVEIGGDSQSTDGTESSHMHSPDDLNYERGYEWWLMKEAKLRNPDIKLYGLPWAFPGWVGSKGDPYSTPNKTADYVTKWVDGAKKVYGLDIDYVGIWNERNSDATYVKTLRRTLDSYGYQKTMIVAKDGSDSICGDLVKDPEYAKAVDIIGLHYPSDFDATNYSTCHSLNKPVWASEESSSYDDMNGAACWARVVNSHYVMSGITASIMWNLVGAYYHGTNWYASSMLTAVQPWSGNYNINPVVWATAHYTQFTQVGWNILSNGFGSGGLPQGGFYNTYTDPDSSDWTLVVVKISDDHAACTRPKLPSFSVAAETVTFTLASSMGDASKLKVWRSNMEVEGAPIFENVADIAVGADRKFQLDVAIGDVITISTVTTAQKGGKTPPPSQPEFPLPHSDDFNSYKLNQEAAGFADQIGVFEIHTDSANSSNLVMKQMVPLLPIGWSDAGTFGPVSVIGMREWQDVTVRAKFRIPKQAPANASACIGTRSDQSFAKGIGLCIFSNSTFTLSVGGPLLIGGFYHVYKSGSTGDVKVDADTWYTLELTTGEGAAAGSLNGIQLFEGAQVRDIDTGFATIGANWWYSVEFDDFFVAKASPQNWAPKRGCVKPAVGTKVAAKKCPRNANFTGTEDVQFTLVAETWQLLHDASGLCFDIDNNSPTLQKCDGSKASQQFRNDYTRIRNTEVPITVENGQLAAQKTGEVLISTGKCQGDWCSWSYFPNSHQLRNQFSANPGLGQPMCLSACGN